MITGDAAGVPFVAVEPSGGPRAAAPVVVGWHLLDAPRTERAFAAALPLDGLDAWRFYLGLPMSGSRSPAGGAEEMMRLGAEDAIGHVYEPVNAGAAEEFPAVLAALRDRFGVADDAPLAVLGGSAGSAVALEVVARGVAVTAAVLVSPVPRLASLVEELEELFATEVPKTPQNAATTARMDYVARAAELGTVPIRVIVGDGDSDRAVLTPCSELVAALEGPSDLVTIAGMAHALAEEPGTGPAPQTPHAAEVDDRAVDWFRRYL